MGGTGLELSTRIRKQNVVPVLLGFKTILLTLGELALVRAGILSESPLYFLQEILGTALYIVHPPKMSKKLS